MVPGVFSGSRTEPTADHRDVAQDKTRARKDVDVGKDEQLFLKTTCMFGLWSVNSTGKGTLATDNLNFVCG
jgi:hypothetical protein